MDPSSVAVAVEVLASNVQIITSWTSKKNWGDGIFISVKKGFKLFKQYTYTCLVSFNAAGYKCEWLIDAQHQFSNFSAISLWEPATFRRDDNYFPFLVDQHSFL